MHHPHHHIARILEQAWKAKNIDLLRNSLAEDLIWHEEPFDLPLTNVDAVVAVWKKDLANQNDLRVKVEVLDSAGKISYFAMWYGSR